MITRIFRNIFLAAALALCSPILLSSQNVVGTAKELANAAQSPYDIERFVETHATFDWGPLWKALNIPEPDSMTGCVQQSDAERRCSSELIMVLSPLQAIILLRQNDRFDEVALRFLGELQPGGSTRWRFAGHFEPKVHYFQPQHRIVMFGKKPYFVVTQQGEASGTGMSTELESWLDLTRSEFEPVFSYTSGKNISVYDGVSRNASGGVVWLQEMPTESITVEYRVSFASEDDTGKEIPLGSRSDKAVFTRTEQGKFRIDDKLSSTSSKQIGLLYEDSYVYLSNEEFLRYDLASLKEIASKTESAQKRWLRRFLPKCADTPEKKQLSELLRTNSTQPPSRVQAGKPSTISSKKKP